MDFVDFESDEQNSIWPMTMRLFAVLEFCRLNCSYIGMIRKAPRGWDVPSRPREMPENYPKSGKIRWEISSGHDRCLERSAE